MRLVLVVPGPLDRRSGGYSYDVDLVEALRQDGHEVEVENLASPRRARQALSHRMRTTQADAVVFDALVHGPLVATLEALRPGYRGLWMGLVHHLAWLEDPGRHTEGKKSRERRFLNLMDAFLFNSEDTRRSVAELRGPGAPFRPSVICRPPLGSSRPTVLPGQGRFLFLGNLVPRKNLHGLIEALGLLLHRRPDLTWSLIVAGSPDLDRRYARFCRQRAERLGLGPRVSWEGRVSDLRREELWSADLFTLPSFHEGWGMAHAEALAHGVPALAVPRGGVREVLGDAALWSEDQPEALSQALEAFLDQPERAQELAQKAQRRALLLQTVTGFGPLREFLSSLGPAPAEPPPPSFEAYLDAKASVDDRSLHPRVRETAFSRGRPRSVIEYGGGTGTMAVRLLKGGWIDPETTYDVVDANPVGLELARGRAHGFAPGHFSTRQADLWQAWNDDRGAAPDLVIAHAVLDLLEPWAAARALAFVGARRYWLTHLFDGFTAWEPTIDPDLDAALVAAYHRSMDERAFGGAQGSSRSGRDWLTILPDCGFGILDAAASDWIVTPSTQAPPGDEVFLRSLWGFFRSSLTGRPDVDQAGLAWWLRVRATQIAQGRATFLARQLDLAVELTNPGS